MTVGNTFTDFYDAMQARDIARGGGAPLGVILTEINLIKAEIDQLAADGGLSATLGGVYSVASAAISAAGTGYAPNDVLTLSGGTFTNQAQIIVLTVTSGAIATFAISEAGSYSVAPTTPNSPMGGTGTGAAFTLTFSPIATPMTASESYFNAWFTPTQYVDAGSVLCRSRMDVVIRYFSALGFRIQRQRVGITDFFQWYVTW